MTQEHRLIFRILSSTTGLLIPTMIVGIFLIGRQFLCLELQRNASKEGHNQSFSCDQIIK